MTEKIVAILRAARERMERTGWTEGGFYDYRIPDLRETPVSMLGAVLCAIYGEPLSCLDGSQEQYRLQLMTQEVMQTHLDRMSIEYWNDNICSSMREALGMFDSIIMALEGDNGASCGSPAMAGSGSFGAAIGREVDPGATEDASQVGHSREAHADDCSQSS